MFVWSNVKMLGKFPNPVAFTSYTAKNSLCCFFVAGKFSNFQCGSFTCWNLLEIVVNWLQMVIIRITRMYAKSLWKTEKGSWVWSRPFTHRQQPCTNISNTHSIRWTSKSHRGINYHVFTHENYCRHFFGVIITLSEDSRVLQAEGAIGLSRQSRKATTTALDKNLSLFFHVNATNEISSKKLSFCHRQTQARQLNWKIFRARSLKWKSRFFPRKISHRLFFIAKYALWAALIALSPSHFSSVNIGLKFYYSVLMLLMSRGKQAHGYRENKFCSFSHSNDALSSINLQSNTSKKF